MATAPKVQSISQIMTEYDPAFKQQKDLIQQKQAGLGAKYEGQVQALDAKKAQGFTDINTQATGRGMSFSGIPLDEQARYLSTEYLPGRTNLKYQENEENLALQGQLADIYKQQYTGALGAREQQSGALNQWNMQLMQQENAAREAEKDRQFQAQQNAMNRAAANQPDEELTPYEAAASIAAQWSQTGEEMTSDVFQNMRDAYRIAGGNTSTFAKEFWKYVPKSQQTGDKWKAYYYG